MPETISQLKDILSGATDNEGNVLDMVTVNHVIVSLEGMTITPEDLHLLQATRIVKKVQDIRRRTTDNKLAKRIKKLVKKWQSLLQNYTPPGAVINTKHVNGMVPAENGIDAKSKPSLSVASSPIFPNTNGSGSSNVSQLIDANQKSIKLKQQFCSATVQSTVRPSSSTITNSAPHPISADCRHKMVHTNTTVVTFVHPPPEPMPSSLIVSISRHSVKLKEQSLIPGIHISSDENNTENSHVTAEDTLLGVMNVPHDYCKLLSDRNLELFDIKSEPSTGKHTPVDEIIAADGYLLDMNMDYNSIVSAMSEADNVFNTEDLSGHNDGCHVEGIDGFFSCEGMWCDWTQPIPPKDEDSVVVLPYVYID